MDFFRALTGGTKFDKQRFQSDVEIFEQGTEKDEYSANSALNNKKSINALNFFGDGETTETTTGSAKQSEIVDDNENQDTEKAEEETHTIIPLDTVESLSLFRKKYQIRVYGDDVPHPYQNFQEMFEKLQLPKYLISNVQSTGYAHPTPIQMQSIPVIAQKRDVLSCAPTGSGKTLAYLLPILHALQAPSKEGFRACIIAPTRELAQQILRELNKLIVGRKWKACVLSKATQAGLGDRGEQKFDILISTPLRLVYAIQQGRIHLDKVQRLVLDEADKLLEEGFLEQVDEIIAACSLSQRQTSMFSATFSTGIELLAKTVMKIDVVRVTIGTKNAATESINQQLIYVGDESGKLVTFRQALAAGDFKPPVLVFVQSVDRAKELFHELVYDGVNVDVIHADRTKQQRDNIIDQFRLGRIWVLIATDVVGRGIDFKGVNCVVNYDFPTSTQSYIHRIGRTGRAGRLGNALTYYTRDDAQYLRSIVNVMRESGCQVPEWMVGLRKASREARKELKRRGTKRTHINTMSQYDIKQQQHKKNMISNSKRKKMEADV